MHMFRYFLSRAIQFVGNLIKGIFFAVHFFAPKLRFEIPKFAPPLLKGRRDRGRVPRDGVARRQRAAARERALDSAVASERLSGRSSMFLR